MKKAALILTVILMALMLSSCSMLPVSKLEAMFAGDQQTTISSGNGLQGADLSGKPLHQRCRIRRRLRRVFHHRRIGIEYHGLLSGKCVLDASRKQNTEEAEGKFTHGEARRYASMKCPWYKGNRRS